MILGSWTRPQPYSSRVYAQSHELPGGGTAFVIAEVGGFENGFAISDLLDSSLPALFRTTEEPTRVFEALNRLVLQAIPQGNFAPVGMAIHRPSTLLVDVLNAGIEQPYIIRSNGDALVTVRSHAPALGLIEIEASQLPAATTVEVSPQDILVFHVGVVDLRNLKAQVSYPEPRLREVAQNACRVSLDPKLIAESIGRDCDEFLEGEWSGASAAVAVAGF